MRHSHQQLATLSDNGPDFSTDKARFDVRKIREDLPRADRVQGCYTGIQKDCDLLGDALVLREDVSALGAWRWSHER